MGLNRAFDRPFMVMNGAVRKSGGSNLLAKGQLALVDNRITTQNGIGIVSTTAGAPRNEKVFELRLGIKAIEPSRSMNNFSESTKPFSLDEVVALKVSAPQITEQKLDEVILGYNGIDPKTAFSFKKEDSYFRVTLQMKGGFIQYRGGNSDTELISVNIQMPACNPFDNCDSCNGCDTVDCKEIVGKAIDALKHRPLTGGIEVQEVVEITPVYSCENTLGTVQYTYYTLSVCDTGTDGAEALVASQYNYPVTRTDRVGSTSIYTLLVPATAGAPAAYTQTLASVVKDCNACPAGWTAVVGGFLYAFTMEDDGVDKSSVFSGLTNAVAGSTVKSGNDNGVGFYTTVLSAKLTPAQIATLLGGTVPNNTITVSLVGDVDSICKNATVTSTSWVAGTSCYADTQDYTITLPDNECGNDRLVELQLAYPNLTIVIADSSVSETLTGTLNSGTTGLFSIKLGGVTYSTTYATSYTVTATNFVTANAAAILSATGIVVTSTGAALIFNGDSATLDAVTNTGVIGWTPVYTDVPARSACQTGYTGTAITNIVCDECDDVFLDNYTSENPDSYEGNVWNLVEVPSTVGGCLCGIRFKARPFVLSGEEALRDSVGFTETSVQIEVSGDYPDEIREGIGQLPTSTASKTWLSRQQLRTHLGGNLLGIEAEGLAYFRDLTRSGDYLERLLTGGTSNIEDLFAQYVHYTLQVKHRSMTQGFAQDNVENINYDIYVELGKHKDTEDLLNNIAANAGVQTVKATA